MTDSDKALVLRQANAIAESEWSEARKKFVLENYCNDAPAPVARVFMEEAMRRGLSPEAKQIYLIPRKDHGAVKWMSQTSIDGYRVIADRTRRYAGSDEPVYAYDAKGVLEKATVTVWKMVERQRCPFTAAAYYTDYKGNTPLWTNMPRVMLAKCAEALALRKAFPAELSGIYTDAEMDQADVIEAAHSMQPSASVHTPPQPSPAIAPGSVTGPGSALKIAKGTLWDEAQRKSLTLDLLKQLAQNTMGAALDDMTTSAIVQLTQTIKRTPKDDLLDLATNRPAEVIDAETVDMFPDVQPFDIDSPERFTR